MRRFAAFALIAALAACSNDSMAPEMPAVDELAAPIGEAPAGDRVAIAGRGQLDFKGASTTWQLGGSAVAQSKCPKGGCPANGHVRITTESALKEGGTIRKVSEGPIDRVVFRADRGGTGWVADITYVPNGSGHPQSFELRMADVCTHGHDEPVCGEVYYVNGMKLTSGRFVAAGPASRP